MQCARREGEVDELARNGSEILQGGRAILGAAARRAMHLKTQNHDLNSVR